MSTRLLLIDADAPFTAELSRALEAQGLDVRVTGDGGSGLDLARDARPDAIVLCVELPKMSGYAVCQRMRKDDALKSIPLVITSSEATAETFENHRKLKVRADAYLHKPFAPAALLDALRPLVALPSALPAAEELVTLDDVEELSGEMPLEPLPEPAAGLAAPGEDEDLRILDSAFDHIAAEPAPPLPEPPLAPDERAMAGDELRAAAALLPVEDEAAHSEIDKLGEEADKALAALGAEDVVADLDLDARALLDEPPQRPPGGDSDDLLRAAGIHVVSAQPPVPAAGAARDAELRRLEDRVSELLIEAARAREALERREADMAQLRAGAEALEARLRGAEAEHASRSAERGSREAEALEAAERARAQASEQVEAARAEAARAAEAQVEAVRTDARREAELRRQADEHLARAEEARAQAEERARHVEAARIQASEALARAEQARQEAADALAGAEQARTQADESRARAEAARAEAEQARGRAEEEARAAAERAGAAEAELSALRHRAEESEQAHSLKAAQLSELAGHRDSLTEKLSAVEAELAGALALRPQLEALRGDLDLARADAESARGDAERRTAELQRRIQEIEATNAKHEERIVKAYQKIKSDEKIREKTRKALAIALQLLDERLGAAPAKEGEAALPRRE